jgi:hypothetical protein
VLRRSVESTLKSGHSAHSVQCRPLYPRLCSLIPGLSVKLSVIVLARPTVLSAVGTCPPHDGVRRRWWINVASAVSSSRARKKSDDLTTAIVLARDVFPACAGTENLCSLRGSLLV